MARLLVIPAKAGIQNLANAKPSPWIPAFAGMTPYQGATEEASRRLSKTAETEIPSNLESEETSS